MDRTDFSPRITATHLAGWLHGFLAMLGLAGPLVLLFAGLLTLPWAASYSLVRDSISSLAWTAMGWVQDLSFVTTGLFVEGFAAALALKVRGARGFGLGIILLAFSGFFLLLAGVFRADIRYFPPTIDGAVHGVAANTAFILLPLASLLIAPSLKKNPYWRSLFLYSIATAAFALTWIAVYRLWLPKELSWFGLYERVLAVVEIVWVGVMAIWLLPLCRKSRQNAPRASDGRTISEQKVS